MMMANVTSFIRKVAKELEYGESELRLIMSSVPDGVSDDEVGTFLYQCRRTGLNPLFRQIYLVARFDKRKGRNVGSVQTGIDGYRLIADRTGQYAGSDDTVFDEGLTQFAHKKTERPNPATATVTVWKMVGGVRCPFTATAEWDSYFPGPGQGFMWNKMPYVLLGKVAEALALRKAFPDQLSGVYTQEEMEQAGPTVEITGTVSVAPKTEEPLNPMAVKVIDKMRNSDIDYTDETLEAVIGGPIAKIPNTDEGTELLRALWVYATSYPKGADAAMDALSKSMKKLEPIHPAMALIADKEEEEVE